MTKAAFPFPAELKSITATYGEPAMFQLRNDCFIHRKYAEKPGNISMQFGMIWDKEDVNHILF